MTGNPVSDHGARVQSLMTKVAGSGSWICQACGHQSVHSTNMRNHIEAHHLPTSGYSCPECGKYCKTKNSLNVHKIKHKTLAPPGCYD